jgi:voltage-gated potassium channel
MSDTNTRALRRNVLNASIALVAVHVVGTLGYRLLGNGHPTLFDAFYMTFITVATVGYAEVVDLTGNVPGRLFTVGIAITGIGSLWVIFSNLTALLLARTMDPARRRIRMMKEIANMQDHYIVCGLGRIGSALARELRATHHPFVAIEPAQAVIDAFRLHEGEGEALHAFAADANDDDALLAAGLVHARGVFAATGDDSRNMLIALSVKQLNPRARVVARVHDVRNVEKCRRAGADEIVSPDFTGALRMAAAMLRPQATGFIDELLHRSDAMRMIDVPVPDHFTPRPLGDLQLRATQYLVVGVRRASAGAAGGWQLNPEPETELSPGAVLIAMATPAGKLELQRMLEEVGR